MQPSLLYCTRRHAAELHNNRASAVSLSACVRRLDLEARSAHRRAEIAKLPCCKTLNFGYVVVKKPISKRTPMHSTGPLTAAKHLKAAKLKETTAPIAVRDMTVGMPPRYSHGPCALAAPRHAP